MASTFPSATRPAYGVNSQKATQLLISGLTASAVMTSTAYLLRGLEIAAPDYAALYGAILLGGTYPAPFTGVWWAGFFWHAVNGTLIFSFLYDYFAHRMILPNQRWTKGLAYGAGIWVLVGLVVAPLAGLGLLFRETGAPVVMTLTSLATWLVYGLVLDGMTRVRATHQLGLSHKKAA